MKIAGVLIDTQTIEGYLRGCESVPVSVFEFALDLLCGRFKSLFPEIVPSTQISTASGTGNDAVVFEVVTFSNDVVASAFSAAYLYRKFHECITPQTTSYHLAQ